jgi:hypothetical protein
MERMNRARWIQWERPARYGAVIERHLPWALVAGLVWLATFIPLRWLPIQPCTMLKWTGVPCPFCGYTRSFSAISAGAWHEAILNAPLAPILYLLMAGVFIWHVAGLATGHLIRRGPALSGRRLTILLVILGLLALGNWLYRLVVLLH